MNTIQLFDQSHPIDGAVILPTGGDLLEQFSPVACQGDGAVDIVHGQYTPSVGRISGEGGGDEERNTLAGHRLTPQRREQLIGRTVLDLEVDVVQLGDFLGTEPKESLDEQPGTENGWNRVVFQGLLLRGGQHGEDTAPPT